MTKNQEKSKYLSLRPPKNIVKVENLCDKYREIKEKLLMLNGVWRDVQKLNNFCHCLLGKLTEEKDNFKYIVNGLEVITKDFYVYFSIVYKLLENISGKYPKDKNITRVFTNLKKKIGKKVQILRNNLIIHMEKPDFKHTHGSILNTSHGGLFMTLITEQDDFDLVPLKDGKIIERCLYRFKEIFENKKQE